METAKRKLAYMTHYTWTGYAHKEMSLYRNNILENIKKQVFFSISFFDIMTVDKFALNFYITNSNLKF